MNDGIDYDNLARLHVGAKVYINTRGDIIAHTPETLRRKQIRIPQSDIRDTDIVLYDMYRDSDHISVLRKRTWRLAVPKG